MVTTMGDGIVPGTGTSRGGGPAADFGVTVFADGDVVAADDLRAPLRKEAKHRLGFALLRQRATRGPLLARFDELGLQLERSGRATSERFFDDPLVHALVRILAREPGTEKARDILQSLSDLMARTIDLTHGLSLMADETDRAAVSLLRSIDPLLDTVLRALPLGGAGRDRFEASVREAARLLADCWPGMAFQVGRHVKRLAPAAADLTSSDRRLIGLVIAGPAPVAGGADALPPDKLVSSLVHEATHQILFCIERITPLAVRSDATFVSPWSGRRLGCVIYPHIGVVYLNTLVAIRHLVRTGALPVDEGSRRIAKIATGLQTFFAAGPGDIELTADGWRLHHEARARFDGLGAGVA